MADPALWRRQPQPPQLQLQQLQWQECLTTVSMQEGAQYAAVALEIVQQLRYAIRRSLQQCVAAFLAAGADVNVGGSARHPLWWWPRWRTTTTLMVHDRGRP